jgi:hypothetical protein
MFPKLLTEVCQDVGCAKRHLLKEHFCINYLRNTMTEGALQGANANGDNDANFDYDIEPMQFPIHKLSIKEWKTHFCTDMIGQEVSAALGLNVSYSRPNSDGRGATIFNLDLPDWDSQVPEDILQEAAEEFESTLRNFVDSRISDVTSCLATG